MLVRKICPSFHSQYSMKRIPLPKAGERALHSITHRLHTILPWILSSPMEHQRVQEAHGQCVRRLFVQVTTLDRYLIRSHSHERRGKSCNFANPSQNSSKCDINVKYI